MKVSLVVAVAHNGVIGREGDLPWRLSDDLRHFKALTTGHPVIMGRRTYESIGRALPDRRNIVLTRREGWRPEGAETARSLEDALERIDDEDEVFVIGGERVFREALDRADAVYLTRVEADVEGDTHFPALDPRMWRVVEAEPHAADRRNEHPYSFETWVRRDQS